VKPRTSGTVVRLAAPLRALAHRFSFALLICAAVVLMMAGKVDALLVESVRARVTDAFTPILDAFSRPAATMAHAVESALALQNAYEENERLKTENARLLQWRQAALKLEAENNSLRNLLRYAPEKAASFVTGRVVAAPGGSFVRTLVVTAGAREGVRKGQAAVAGAGMVGRVIDVGEWSSRVLLLTDISARVPVMLENSRMQAVLAGDNSDQPRLLYLPPESPAVVGERVVTSGYGGLFPPGIPVGVVASVSERGVRVELFADPSRLEHVRLVDYGVVTGPGDSELVAGAR
jgi:rod shape-determining protein MreC